MFKDSQDVPCPERAEEMSFHDQVVGSYRYMERVKIVLKEKNQRLSLAQTRDARKRLTKNIDPT